MATVPRPWSQEEDNLLRQAVAIYGEEPGVWKIIASTIPGRSNKACRKRWLHSLSPTVRKVPWTPAEDALLLKLYAAHNPPRWSLIAKQIPGRTDDACSKRYREALDPLLKKDSWSEEEDSRLLQLTSQLGTKWTQVGQAMGRSGLGCRNRWRLLQRKQRSKKNVHEPYTLSCHEQQIEDNSYMELQNAFNVGEEFLSGFTPDQFDNRLHHDHLDPNVESLPPPSFSINRIDQTSASFDISTVSPLSQVLGFISNSNTLVSSHNWQCLNSSTDSASFGLLSLSHSPFSASPSSSNESQLHHSPSEQPHISHTSQSPEIEYPSPETVSYPIIAECLEHHVTVSSEASKTSRPTTNKPLSRRDSQAKRLSAHLPADTERTVLPYACGHSLCWPSASGPGISNFATASDLAEHRRLVHGRDGDTNPNSKDKPFRCALEGCGKGWKNINGIQYHLQISKAHFQDALQKQSHKPTTAANEGTYSGQMNQQLDTVSDDGISDLTINENVRVYRCPRKGCHNRYKQRTGLAYHLTHGHPIDLAQLDVIPPVLLRKMASKGGEDANTTT